MSDPLSSEDFRTLYEVHSFRHASEVLRIACPTELEELVAALLKFRLTTHDILKAGGNESAIPKKLAKLLRPGGWYETRISGGLRVSVETHTEQGVKLEVREIASFVDGHKIDFVRDRVAFDLEWNSKDQTFDRDLYAFRTFHDADIISVAVLLTRSEELNPVFSSLGVKKKYGASTTWMGKLTSRLKAGRNGSCPVLALGIRPSLIEDWQK